MIEDSIYQYTSSVLYALIQLLIIVAAIILALKNQSLATMLILIGAILSGLMQIITPILYSYFIDSTDNFLKLNFIISLISSVFYALFGIGLLLLALSYKKHQIN